MRTAELIFPDGTKFRGQSFGAEKIAAGEAVFTTAMTGFELALTDPSFADQILVFTFPLVGNYGVPNFDRDEFGILKNFESEKIYAAGVVVANFSAEFSHHRAAQSFRDFLISQKIPAIAGVDTRKLTEFLRDRGSSSAQIVPENLKPEKNFYDPNAENLVAKVSIQKPKIFAPKNFQKTIVAVDTGIKNNILREFLRRKIRVILVPWNFDLRNLNEKIDGLFLANGPGDPRAILPEIKNAVEFAREKNWPIFGICLGNQLLNLAFGGSVSKMKFGNRGANQPVQNLQNEKCFVTAQNHGFAVEENSLPRDFEVWFKNLNDGSVEGIRHKKLPIFSVQFHPEAAPGPTECGFLFDEFLAGV